MADLFITLAVAAAYTVLIAGIAYAVGRGRDRALHETRVIPTDSDYLDRLLVDGGSLRAAERERRMRVVK